MSTFSPEGLLLFYASVTFISIGFAIIYYADRKAEWEEKKLRESRRSKHSAPATPSSSAHA